MVNILSKSQSSARSHEIQLNLYSVCYKFWKLQMRQNLNIMEIFTLENKIGKQGTIPKNFGQVVSLHFCRSILTYGRQKV